MRQTSNASFGTVSLLPVDWIVHKQHEYDQRPTYKRGQTQAAGPRPQPSQGSLEPPSTRIHVALPTSTPEGPTSVATRDPLTSLSTSHRSVEMV